MNLFWSGRTLMQAADANPGQGAPPAANPPAPAVPPAPQGAVAPPAPPPQQPPANAQPPEPPKPPQNPAAPTELAIKLPPEAKADQKFIDGFVAVGKKLGVSQEQAQGIADFLMQAQGEQSKAWADALPKAIAQNEAQLKADPNWGGPKYDATVKAADSALKQFIPEEGIKELTDLGMHNRPWLVKSFALIRSLIAEDSVSRGTKPAVTPDSRAAQLQKMFPNSPQMFAPRT